MNEWVNGSVNDGEGGRRGPCLYIHRWTTSRGTASSQLQSFLFGPVCVICKHCPGIASPLFVTFPFG